MRRTLRYISIVIFIHTLSLSALIRHIYESDGAQAIQDSIDVSGLYDTVMVHNGKYYIGDLPDSSGIQLKGHRLMSVSPDSASSCILSGLSSSGVDTALHVIRDSMINNSSSLIQGFTITEGKTSTYWENRGGGIQVLNYVSQCSLIIQDNIITENMGGGIFLFWAFALVRRNIILNNEDGGIYIMGDLSGWPIIKDNAIKSNVSDSGGGVFLNSGATKVPMNARNTAMIENNLIIGNYALFSGGGITSMHYAKPCLSRNTIAFNEADEGGGIFIGDYRGSNLDGENNIFIANRANKGGVIYIEECEISASLTRSFAVDNGSFDGKSGLISQHDQYAPPFDMNYSNIYYNTYQQDVEVFIDSFLDSTSLKNSFWWITDSARIDSLIDGPADFIPFEMGFVPDAPGEPVEIYSVLNYSSDYSSIIDSIGGDPDTLYLEITGHDRNPEYKEAAVAILKSNIYPTGIAVALLETDTASGIYRGEAIVKTTDPPDSIRMDDIYQIIRVSPDADTVRIFANMDTTEIFRVYYRCHSGIKEDFQDDFLLESLPNPVLGEPEFRFFLPIETQVELNIYDPSGRLINNVLSEKLPSGWHTVKGNIEKSGVYFYRLKTQAQEKSGKIVIVK